MHSIQFAIARGPRTHFAPGFGASLYEHSYLIWLYLFSRTKILLAGVDVHGNTGTWRKGVLLRKHMVRVTYYFVAVLSFIFASRMLSKRYPNSQCASKL